MREIVVEPATRADLSEVQLLVEEFVSSFPLSAEKYSQSFEDILTNKSACLLVARADTAVIAYSLGFVHDTFYANGKVAWLEELMVSSQSRRSGIGKSLVCAFEAWARDQGAVLSALATRRAPEFYRAIGYEESANYYRRLL